MDLCKKGVLILNSVLLTIIGLGMAAIGGVLRFHTEMLNGYLIPIVKLLPSGGFTSTDVWTLYNYTSIVMIAIGVAIGSLGILGCWIGSCPKPALILVHMFVVVILILIQVSATVLILTMKIEDGIKKPLSTNLLDHYSGDENVTDDYSIAWNYIFVEFSCCGSENSSEFLLTTKWDREKTYENGTVYIAEIPITCCKLPDDYPNFGQPLEENCTTSPSLENSYFEVSCNQKLADYLCYYGILMFTSCGGSVLFEVISFVTLTGMCLEIKRKRNKIKQALT